MRRVVGGVLVAVAAVCLGAGLSLPGSAPAQAGGGVQAGVEVVDSSWRVGASAGQYAGSPEDEGQEFVSHETETFDPTGLSTRRSSSYGIQSRLSVRALVVDGPTPGTGDRFAILKTDFYIPQDLVYRRAAQLVEERCDCGITAANMTMTATHDHSSPMYSSTSWGVWAFQDVFDIRFYEYMARQMADAVTGAAEDMRQVRVGASSSYYDLSHRHSFGPAVADDGTPAGYPQSDQDHDLTVIRFDDISNPSDPEPLANLVNFSQHPEFLEGNDLISADYVAPFERMMDRETGAITVYTQGSVGTSEPERSTYHSVHERAEFSHRDYAQAEWAARKMANSAEDAWQDIEQGTPESTDKYVPFDDDFAVGMRDRWYPGPFSHPYPGVSNCRVDKGLSGDPQLPVVGLPDCMGGAGDGVDALREFLPDEVNDELDARDPGLTTDDFQAAGIPVPENYSAPSYTGLQEDIDVHLQGIRLGEIYLPICSCEQWWDQSRNIELRTNKIAGDETLPGNLGYDWGAQCTLIGGTHQPDGSGDATWSCPDPGNTSQRLPPVSDLLYTRMRAQVNNPANDWNNAENAPFAESEEPDPTKIKGNYSHDDSEANAAYGYDLTVPIAMGNDYNGYIASYREYQRGDHYRKALTGWGPHSSDYLASRLVTIGRQLNGMPDAARPRDQIEEDPLVAKALLDTQVNEARAEALGTNGAAAIDAYAAALPDDGGTAGAVAQPEDVERFDASFFTWNGGSNFTDNPVVRIQRATSPGSWEEFADQSGEIPVTLDYPSVAEGVTPYAQGNQEWHWTAHFEAFVAGAEDVPINTGDRPPATPAGDYRFVVDGERREGGTAVPYHLESDTFRVSPWNGILIQDFRLEADNTLSFVLGPSSTRVAHDDPPSSPLQNPVNGPRGADLTAEIGPIDYPDSYDNCEAGGTPNPDAAPFIRCKLRYMRDPAAPADPDQLEWYCLTCTFRPWLDFGDADPASVRVTITLGNGSTEEVAASKQGERWVTPLERPLRENESAQVRPGDVRDPFGDTNEASIVIATGTAPPDADGDGTLDEADDCVDDPGPPSNNGCPMEPPPPNDGDGDGVPDSADQCPDEPGPIDRFGCPLPQAPAPGDCETRRDGTPGHDSLVGTELGEFMRGLGGPDTLRGGAGDDCLRGGGGDDSVRGDAGDDVVHGGRGRDRLSGGRGDDRMRAKDHHRDRVRCGPGFDRVLANRGDEIGADCERRTLAGRRSRP